MQSEEEGFAAWLRSRASCAALHGRASRVHLGRHHLGTGARRRRRQSGRSDADENCAGWLWKREQSVTLETAAVPGRVLQGVERLHRRDRDLAQLGVTGGSAVGRAEGSSSAGGDVTARGEQVGGQSSGETPGAASSPDNAVSGSLADLDIVLRQVVGEERRQRSRSSPQAPLRSGRSILTASSYSVWNSTRASRDPHSAVGCRWSSCRSRRPER